MATSLSPFNIWAKLPYPPTYGGTGQVTLGSLTSSGSGLLSETGTDGAPTFGYPTSSGSGTTVNPVTGTGFPTSQYPTTTGSGTLDESGSGSPVAQYPTTSGTGRLDESGSGSPSIQYPTASGSGRLDETGSGSPALQSPTTIGSGSFVVGVSGSGSPIFASVTVISSGILKYTGSGSPTFSNLTIISSGTFYSVSTGSGSVTLASPQPICSGVLSESGSGSVSVSVPTISASGYLPLIYTFSGTTTGSVAVTAVVHLLNYAPGQDLSSSNLAFFSFSGDPTTGSFTILPADISGAPAQFFSGNFIDGFSIQSTDGTKAFTTNNAGWIALSGSSVDTNSNGSWSFTGTANFSGNGGPILPSPYIIAVSSQGDVGSGKAYLVSPRASGLLIRDAFGVTDTRYISIIGNDIFNYIINPDQINVQYFAIVRRAKYVAIAS